MGFIEDTRTFKDMKNIFDNSVKSLSLNDDNVKFTIKNSTHSKKWYIVYKHMHNISIIIFIIQLLFTLFRFNQYINYQQYYLLIINITICVLLYIFKDFTLAKRDIYDNRFFLYYNEYLRLVEKEKSADVSTFCK